jgi:hypothetical protein
MAIPTSNILTQNHLEIRTTQSKILAIQKKRQLQIFTFLMKKIRLDKLPKTIASRETIDGIKVKLTQDVLYIYL